MASSSPTSSCSSAYSSPFSSSKFSSLPVMLLREKIVEKIKTNRVTLIVGETGCGKSSQVPQFLLGENMAPILCTQPRRFAVVAVAKMVAKARNCELGGEVGYHIGHSRHLSPSSKIVFKTAGVLLDELREKGLTALKYKAIILDEVHERSVESDLVLVCVKQFLLKNKDLRLVLMSATADISRYRDYFRDLGRGERVEVLAIPNSYQKTVYQRSVLYIEQVAESLGISSELVNSTYTTGSDCSTADATMKPGLHKLIHDLVLHIHENERDIEKSILVFLPTYYSLEQQWRLLKPLDSTFRIHILHSSIDTEQALMAMKICKSHRKVILATNIAESSVTIPNVAFVIDSCRSLQVLWDKSQKRESSELVWVSKSQAEQRRGRTGRTCNGKVYRLVTRSFFSKFEDYEHPAILKLSLRLQVLLICCAESKAINDPKVGLIQNFKSVFAHLICTPYNLLVLYGCSPSNLPTALFCYGCFQRALATHHTMPYAGEKKLSSSVNTDYVACLMNLTVLLQKALDPPDPYVVEDAFDLLVQMHALEKIPPRGRYEPTFYGRLLASLPLSFDASVLILKFGDIGMLHEGILLGIMMDTQPRPILHPFGEEALFARYIDHYYSDKSILTSRKEMAFMGNICAFQFWQHVFRDKYLIERLKQVLGADELKPATQMLPKLEEEWCSFHYLLRSSLHQVLEIYHEILHSVHRFRPKFLNTSHGLPSYHDPYKFKHTCHLECQPNGHDVVAADEEGLEPSSESRRCVAVPYVTSNHFHTIDVAKQLAAIVKEIRAEYAEDASGHQQESVDDGSLVNGQASLCVFFIKGYCSRGSQCLFSHSSQAKRPQCKFFFSLQGCRNGESCHFSHDVDRSVPSLRPNLCLPEDNDVNAASLLDLFPTSSNKSILILDDFDLHFSSHLACYYVPAKIISTSCLSETTICEPSLTGVRILWGLHNPYQAIIAKAGRTPIPWNEVQCVLWFPSFDSCEDLDGQKHLLQNFFEYLAVRILADALYDLQIIITMNNIRFSQLQVEKWGRECFFFLRESFAFDEESFGELYDRVSAKKPMVVSRPISYVFAPRFPADNHFGNYAATIQKCLHNFQKN